MIIQGTQTILADQAANIMVDIIRALLKKQDQVVLAVPGGRTVGSILANLQMMNLPWQKVQCFMLDERLVPADHHDSNYRLVQKHLGGIVPAENLHPVPLGQGSAIATAARYNAELAHFGGAFDLVLASSGEDGHIASLFPRHPSLASKETGYITVSHSPKPPAGRISASASLIRSAYAGLLLFFGEEKKAALRNFFDTDLALLDCPAKIVSELSRYYVLTDQEESIP